MMKYLTVYLMSIVFGVLLVGCQLLGTGKSNNNKPSSSYFPLTPGSTWTYAEYDSTYSMYETKKLDSNSHIRVKVTVLKNVQVDANQVKSLWQFQSPGHADTVSVYSTDNSAQLTIPPISYGPATFALPLSIGKKWSGSEFSGNFSVISAEILSFNGMNFSKAYHIVQTPGGANGHNEFINIEYWIQPHVGIVKAYKSDNCTVCGVGGLKVVVLELLSYNLKP